MKPKPFGVPRGARVDINKQAPPSVAWIEVAPGLSFGARALPGRWARWWMGKLLGWQFHTKRPG